MATIAVNTETLLELSFKSILNANSSIYPTNWPGFPDFLDQPFDVKNTGVQETANLDGENVFDSKNVSSSIIIITSSYVWTVQPGCLLRRKLWVQCVQNPWPTLGLTHRPSGATKCMFELIICQLIFTKDVKDLQNRPATLPLASAEESSSNPANSVTPF